DAKYGKDPREYLIQTKKIISDGNGNVKELHTIQMEKILGEDGYFFFKEVTGTEKIWPAQFVFIAIGFEGPETTLAEQFGVQITNKKIAASAKDYKTNVEGVFTAGDARRGQSLIVWAIKEGQEVAKRVSEYVSNKPVISL